MTIDIRISEIGFGQYDDAYSQCDLLWGKHPAANVIKAAEYFNTCNKKKALDLGCGEGKNSAFLASKDFEVTSIDVSVIAIQKAKNLWNATPGINWLVNDIRKFKQNPDSYHIVLLTGPLHCFSNKNEVTQTIENAKSLTITGGVNIISVFNSREHDFSGHSKHFKPLLLSHEFYLSCYNHNWEILEASDTNLVDSHPHNNIPHNHSVTRFIAKKIH